MAFIDPTGMDPEQDFYDDLEEWHKWFESQKQDQNSSDFWFSNSSTSSSNSSEVSSNSSNNTINGGGWYLVVENGNLKLRNFNEGKAPSGAIPVDFQTGKNLVLVFGKDLLTDERGVSFADWNPEHGIRFTLSFGHGEAPKTFNYESGGDLNDLLSLLTGGVAMSQSFTTGGITSVAKLIDRMSDSFISGNNANPYSGKTNNSSGKKLNTTTEVSTKPSGDTTIYVRNGNNYILQKVSKSDMHYYYIKP